MVKPSPRPISKVANPFWPGVFAGLTGVFLAVALLKFGNPIIFDEKIAAPTDIFEIIFQPWPTRWGYILVGVMVAVGLAVGNWKITLDRKSAFGLFLPIIWMAWQFVSATKSVDPTLTRLTLKHFTVCVTCFYLGWFCLSQVQNYRPVILGILSGMGLVILAGWQQHFGGLEETRQFFYQQPNWRDYPPEFLKRVASTRIYSTLFYPNTLAAAILLFLPISLWGLWSLSAMASLAARICLLALLGAGAMGCLVWSGSKSGWLLFLVLGFLGLLQLSFKASVKKGLVIGLLVIGLGGFALKYASFFQRGATSVVARFDYWRAAVEITKLNPLLGTGPGTFFIPYQKIKAPEAEMTRLCHNDYLQQASDSGIPGFLTFTAFIFGSLLIFRPKSSADPMKSAIWLGLVGTCLHSLVEFNLYIPALSWPTFLFLGWLWTREETNRQPPARSVTSRS